MKPSDGIIKIVCEHRGVDIEDMLSPKRTAMVAHARQEAMALLSELLKWSLPQIGEAFNRDHTTILHGLRAVQKRTRDNAEDRYAMTMMREKCDEALAKASFLRGQRPVFKTTREKAPAERVRNRRGL